MIAGKSLNGSITPFSVATEMPDASLFESIKVDPQFAAEKIAFWGRQMSEHALFLYLMLEDEGQVLKNKALELHNAFEEYMQSFKEDSSMENMNNVLPLLSELIDFKTELLQKMLAGEWIGWAYPLFVDHIKLEARYFARNLNGIFYSIEDEIAFWNRINSEHAGFAAHLLDPSELQLVEQASKTSAKIRNIPKTEREMFLKLSLQAGRELDQFNKKAKAAAPGQIKSVIHPVLLDHVIREGEEGNRTLEMLATKYPGSAQKIHAERKKLITQYDQFE